MLMHCPNKKCNTTTDQRLDTGSDLVICLSCGEANTNVTSINKSTLKQLGHIIKSAPQSIHNFYCKNCKKNQEAVLVDDCARCKECRSALQITNIMVETLKNLKLIERVPSPAKEEPEVRSIIKKAKKPVVKKQTVVAPMPEKKVEAKGEVKVAKKAPKAKKEKAVAKEKPEETPQPKAE